YIKSLPKFHNTLLVFRDGQSEKPSAFCELEHLADFTRVGFSETSLKDYAGVDWHRNVVWKKEGWFAVLDRVVARQDGDYSLRCQWRAMGAPTLAAPSFLVEQQGESLRIENADGSRLMLKEDAETGKNWGGYKLAEPVVRVLSQVTDRRLKSGEKHAFLNVLRVSPTDDAGDLKVRKLSDTCVEVTSDGQVALLGVGKSEMTDAALFFVDADGLALVGATQFAAGSFRLSADKPVDLEFDNKSGNGVAVASAATTLRVGDEAFAFPAAGKHEFQLKQGHAPFYALASLHPVAPDPKQPFVAPTTHLPTTPPPQNTSLLWRYRKEFDTYLLTNNRGRLEAYDTGSSVSVAPKPLDKNVFDPASPNSPEALTDGVTNTTEGSLMWAADQKVAVTVDLKNRYDLSRVVARLWWGSQSSKGNKFTYDHIRFSVSDDNFAKDVRVALDKAETDTYKDWGEPISYVAADVKQSGRYVRLEFTPKPGAGVYLAELEVWGKREGMPPSKATSAVNFLCLAACDVDGDGRDEVVAGATDNCVHLIGPDGKKRWTFETGGPVKSVWAGDLDADGKPEIVVGSRDAFIYLLDAQGKLKWKFELPRYHGRAGALVVVFAADLDGDGKKEVIGGSDNWHFYVFDAAGKFLWRYETVHRSTCGTAADLDGDGKLEVITGTEYYWWPVLSWDGKRKWGFSGGPTVNSVAAGDVDGDGKKEVVFGSADGCVYLVSHDGKKRWGFDTGDEVSAVAVADVDGDGKADVLAGSKNFNVYAFRGDGSVLWRRDLGDAVTTLVAAPFTGAHGAPRSGAATLAVGCDNGLVVILSLQGEILARYPAAGSVLALAPGRRLPGPRAQILASCAGDGVVAIEAEK
ncbi:MAG: hypothetical protein FJ272_07095, partial [Planctomycetes bacterium]|nr:hypothetical protein [Planctomycetota bacterium]